jgi:exopolyphosphatase/guanosine-5'-triphosphate,3'-diphosphate pyrophosphatase
MVSAVIDLGTNTFNLLVFENKSGVFKIIHAERQAVGLGLNGINEKRIAPDAQQRALRTLHHFKSQALSFGANTFKAFGTSALRDAENKNELTKKVFDQTGIAIEVIDGLREAELIYKGVKSVHDFEKNTCIMDIGGGSTEFIFVEESKNMDEAFSCNIGVSRVIQLFELSDPLSEEDQKKIVNYFDNHAGRYFQDKNVHTLVGASGSFETFLTLACDQLQDVSKSQIINQDNLLQVVAQLINSSQKERDENTLIIDLRKKMIHIAALKTKWIIDRLSIKEVFVSPASLKEGIMQEMIG